MTTNKENIHPVFSEIRSREEKERFLKQNARVIWMTGLSGAGKTTIAMQLEHELGKRGFFTQVLDGDNVRSGINNNLSFSQDDRFENIRRIAEVSRLFLNCGVICINSFISPTKKIREVAYHIIGRHNMIEVFVDSPVEVCEQRDVKGLYQKARKGLISDFTGISSPFEPPENPDIILNTDTMTVKDCITKCLDYILPIITYKDK